MRSSPIACLFLAAIVLSSSSAAFAQGNGVPATTVATTPSSTGATVAITATTLPADLARAAFTAQGGEKFRSLKSMVLRGSVDLYAPNSTQSIPGGFVIVMAGDKAKIEIAATPPAPSFKQIYDGQQSYSSLPGVELPPMSKFGLAVLSKFDQPGYTVSAIPDRKKQRGFRIADADGYATDFYLDNATGRVMSFLITYNGYTFGTENKKLKEVEGVLVATSFTQRLEMRQGAFFAEYNVKDIKLNQPISDDVFAMPN
jgi:hypothetical protein